MHINYTNQKSAASMQYIRSMIQQYNHVLHSNWELTVFTQNPTNVI